MAEPAPTNWGGWSLEGSNLFVAPIGAADPRIAVWTQYDDGPPQVLAVFVNEQAGQEFMAWVNGALGATAEFSAALARQLGVQ